jgi:hypothetical protein
MYEKAIRGWQKINMLKKINSNYKKELTVEEVLVQSDKFSRLKTFYVLFVLLVTVLNIISSFVEVYLREYHEFVAYSVGGSNFVFLIGFVITSYVYVRRLAKLLQEQIETKFIKVIFDKIFGFIILFIYG